MQRQKQTVERTTGLGAGDAAEDVATVLKVFGQELTSIKVLLDEIHRVIRHQAIEKDWYASGELAAAMGVTVFTVTERWCNRGRIDAQKDPATGKWRIPGREFQRLVRGGGLRPKGK